MNTSGNDSLVCYILLRIFFVSEKLTGHYEVILFTLHGYLSKTT
jgi:hypothetical protein